MADTPVISRPSVGQLNAKILGFSRRLGNFFITTNTKALTIPKDKIKVVCTSDTHNTEPDVPHGDLLIHAGDLSQYGMFDEIQKQLRWLNSVPHSWNIVIAGNHDLLLDPAFVKAHPDRELKMPGKESSDLQWSDIVYLNNSSVEIDIPGSRKITIFGSPLTPRFGNFAFQYDPREAGNLGIWQRLDIPAETDIFITHGPPFQYLDDGGKGCPLLLETLWDVQPRLMVFGHIHPGRGQQILRFDDVVERCYKSVILNEQPWLNVIKMLWVTLTSRLVSLVSSARDLHHLNRDKNYGQLVNAAILGSGRSVRKPIVAYI